MATPADQERAHEIRLKAERELGAIVRIVSSPDGQLFLTMLESRLNQRHEVLRRVDSPEVHRYQGRAQELMELIAEMRMARDRLAQLAVPPVKRI